MRHQRVFIKLSGKSWRWPSLPAGVGEVFGRVASELGELSEGGVQIALMSGGGNLLAGADHIAWGIDRVHADQAGILGTQINSMLLYAKLIAMGHKVKLLSAVPMDAVELYNRDTANAYMKEGYIVVLSGGIGQPFISTDFASVQRAIELNAEALYVAKNGADGVYTIDPQKSDQGKKFKQISYEALLRRKLYVMEPSAVVLAKDFSLPIHIFDMHIPRRMNQLWRETESVGTLISGDGDDEYLFD